MRESGQTLLEFATEYHRRLRDICAQIADDARTDRLERFMDVLREHETKMKSTLSGSQDLAGEDTRNRIFRYPPEDSPLDMVKQTELEPDLTADEAMTRVLTLQTRVVDWYEQLATQASAPHVEADLRQLAELERNSGKKLALCAQSYS